MSNAVNISPERLLEVVNKCLENIESYNGEDDKVYKYPRTLFNFIFNNGEKTFTISPTWTYKGCGIITRFNELKNVAENVIEDGKLIDRDIKLSLTSYNELFKLLNKDKGFEPYIFGNRY